MNPHEEQIARVLANSVRVMTVAQIAKTWWTDTRWGQSRASAAMTRLAREGWLHVQRAFAPNSECQLPIRETCSVIR